MSEWRLALASAMMGVVEGITEYLPISSTGHLILMREWMDATFHESFDVVIQMGAVLAVLVEYRQRFARLLDLRGRHGFAGAVGWVWLGLTTFPATLLGLLFHSAIKEKLFAPLPIAMALFAGGVAMVVLERVLPSHPDADGVDGIGWRRALGIGVAQCLALVPGASRSMCTILGGRLLGLGRRTAAEYSFFAAVPILLMAGVYDFATCFCTFRRGDAMTYAIGLIVSFVVARWTIRFLMRLISTHTFEGFGWYRIALGGVLMGWFWLT